MGDNINTEDFANTVQTLGARYVEEYTRAMQRYMDVLNAAATSGQSRAPLDIAGAQAAQSRHTEFVVAQAPQVLSALSEAGMRYYAALADLGLQTLNGYVESVLHAPTSKPKEVHQQRNALVFHGVHGEQASNAFMVTNHRHESIDVAFDIAEVVSVDGKTHFKPNAKFTPAKCKIAPCAEQVVQCELDLGGKFKPNVEYEGSIAVVGCPEMAIRFCVSVEPASDKKPAPTRAKKKKTSRKATRKAAPRKKRG